MAEVANTRNTPVALTAICSSSACTEVMSLFDEYCEIVINVSRVSPAIPSQKQKWIFLGYRDERERPSNGQKEEKQRSSKCALLDGVIATEGVWKAVLQTDELDLLQSFSTKAFENLQSSGKSSNLQISPTDITF